MHHVKDYDYELPEELIAAHPPAKRTDSRMLVVNRKTEEISHRSIRDLPSFLRANDCLVLNDTKVLPARLFGTRVQTGGKWEGLYLGTGPEGHWKLIGQTRGKVQPGEQIQVRQAGKRPVVEKDVPKELSLTLVSRDEEGVWLAKPEPDGDPVELLNAFGTMPLPPYIRRPVAEESDWQRYQTTYARNPGAVAAPTAGLHLTGELLEECEAAGAAKAFVTLHVGIGTFRPIAAEKLSEHEMHAEWCELSASTAEQIEQAKQTGGRIIAVGTTSVRTLESAAQTGTVQPFSGDSNLFIRPGYEFLAVDALLTNFHLPRSTLLVLVSTFAGRELIQRAYQEAIRERYRFFSYGDAMLIL